MTHDRRREPTRPREPFSLDDDPPPAEEAPRSGWARLGQALGLGALIVIGLALLAVASGLGIYAYYARTLPSPEELNERAARFKSARIYDRNGLLLFEFVDPSGGRRMIAHYEEIPPVLIEAVVATEDASFFTNPGINPLAIARALVQDAREGQMIYGGSTITQQVVKNLFLTTDRTLARKVKEAILAAELTRRYSKEEILEVYLNEVWLGNLSYGIASAAETYFAKDVRDLELHEAALLAGLIQSPIMYDPYAEPEAALARRDVVLRLMQRRGYLTRAEADAASAMPLGVVSTQVTMRAPHMVMHVRQELERLYGEERLYRDGLQVYTTLDLRLQEIAEQAVAGQMDALREEQATNAAIIALDPHTGDILAMVGSADFWSEEIDGQVNVALRPRQPGSTIKPFTYLAGLERGWTPATMLMDVPQSFVGAPTPDWPQNYDGKFWGPLSLRSALANSRNVPAVWALQQVGVEGLQEVMARLGVTSLVTGDCGLSLTLGCGEITLADMTAAYGALASGGQRVTPRAILSITDQEGQTVYEAPAPERAQVVDPRHAYLLTNILADNAARAPTFGVQNPLSLPFPAAAKTGTTNDYHDSWTVGYTPALVAGVWVGNSDNTPMDRVAGSRGAGSIWHDLMVAAPMNEGAGEFAVPEGLVQAEVCAISGELPTEDCPQRRTELFAADQAPTQSCPVHRRVRICTQTNSLASAFCPAESVVENLVEDYGPAWDAWSQAQGKALPPREYCTLHAAPLDVRIALPEGVLRGVVEVRGATVLPGFVSYRVEVGAGTDPAYWDRLTPDIAAPVASGVLYRWDTTRHANGIYTLRVVVQSDTGQTNEARVTAEVNNPVLPPTAPPTVALPTPTLTPTLAAATPTASPTPPPTRTPPAPTASPTAPPTVALPTVATPTVATPTTEPPTTEPPTVAAPTSTVTPLATDEAGEEPTPDPALTPPAEPTMAPEEEDTAQPPPSPTAEPVATRRRR